MGLYHWEFNSFWNFVLSIQSWQITDLTIEIVDIT